MGKLRKNFTGTFILSILGLFAGLLTCVGLQHFPLQSTEFFPFSGIIFALAFSFYSWWFECLHSPWRVLSFFIASTAAFYIAMFAGALGIPLIRLFIEGGESNAENLKTSAVFFGGLFGTALVASARYLFLSNSQDHKALLWRIGLITSVGGVLGAAGFALGPSLGTAIWDLLQLLHFVAPSQSSMGGRSPDTASFSSMFVMWQTGIAPLLALLFPSSPISAQTPSESSSLHPRKGSLSLPIWKKALAVAAFLFLVYFLVKGIRSERQIPSLEAKTRKEVAQRYAEAPPLDNLPAIEPLPPDKVLILHDIHGYVPGPASVQNYSPADPRPPLPSKAVPARSYIVVYEVVNSGQRFHPLEAAASITQSPNAEWTNYRMDHPIYGGPSTLGPPSVRKVSKYGNTIYANTLSFESATGRGSFCYAWPSANFRVDLCLAEPVDEEFLRQYLILHPSSLN